MVFFHVMQYLKYTNDSLIRILFENIGIEFLVNFVFNNFKANRNINFEYLSLNLYYLPI